MGSYISPDGRYHENDMQPGDVPCARRPSPNYDPDGQGGWTPNLPAASGSMIVDVDNHISGIYSRFTRFDQEYVAREAAARAFKASNYSGDPGVWVTAFATNAGLNNQVATDLIISQADALRGALQVLGAQRMRKYAIAGAHDLASAQAVYTDILAQADAIAAQLS